MRIIGTHAQYEFCYIRGWVRSKKEGEIPCVVDSDFAANSDGVIVLPRLPHH